MSQKTATAGTLEGPWDHGAGGRAEAASASVACCLRSYWGMSQPYCITVYYIV